MHKPQDHVLHSTRVRCMSSEWQRPNGQAAATLSSQSERGKGLTEDALALNGAAGRVRSCSVTRRLSVTA